MKHGFFYDIGRQLERPETVFAQLPRLAKAGYSAVMLNVEDAVEFPSLPGIGRKYAWSPETLRSFGETARQNGLEVIPVLPSLGHAKYITTKTGYTYLDEGAVSGECLGCLRVNDEASFALIGKLYDDWCAAVPGKYLHAGMDEAPAMGQHLLRSGRCASLDQPKLFADHCNRLAAMAKERGRQLVIWGDMLYYFPQAIGLLDKSIIVMDWYYYDFPDTPRVELFNFAPVDITKALKEAGFTVWLTPSVWPNLPFGDVADRLGNLRSWCRYGQERGADEYEFNTDWSNHLGFLDFTELLWLTFLKLAPEFKAEGLRSALEQTLRDAYGICPSAELTDALLALGKFHVTGTNNQRCIMPRGAAALITSAPERRAEAARKAESLSQLKTVFTNAKADSSLGERVLAEFRVTVRILQCFWGGIARLSELAEVPGGKATGALRDFADELASSQKEYDRLFCETRYPGDYIIPPQYWCGRVAEELLREADRLERTPGARLFDQVMRLEIDAACPHPAMPVYTLKAEFPGGRFAVITEGLIPFESRYSDPDNEVRHCSVLPMDSLRFPERIRVTVRDYGTVEIRGLRVVFDGKVVTYRPSAWSGPCARQTEGGIALGPKCALVTDPTTRVGEDTAEFLPEK